MLRWAVRLGLALGLCSTAHAQTPPDAALSWVRTQGAESCLGALELASAVETLLERPVWVPAADAQLSVEGYVTREARGFKAVLMTARQDGTIVGRREIISPTADCSSLERPLTLMLALTVDPESGFVPLPDVFDTDADAQAHSLLDTPTAAEPSSQGTADATPKARPVSKGKVREAQPLGTELGRSPTRSRGAFVAAAGGLGQLPRGSAALLVGLLGTRKSWPMGLEGRMWVPRFAPDRQNPNSDLLWHAQLSFYACPVWRRHEGSRLEGHVCLGLAPNLTVMRDTNHTHEVGAGVDAELLLQAIASTARNFSVFLGFTLGAMLHGQTFVQNGQTVWQTPYVRGVISAGLFFPR